MRLIIYGISGLADTNDTVDSTQFFQSEPLDQTNDLISAYFEIKNLLGQSPTSEDIEIYGRYKINEYIDKWGNWDKFLEHIGEKIIISDELKQDLIKEYYEERELFGSDPSPQEIDEFGIYKMDDYKKVFGSWFGFLIYIEELDKLNGKNEKEEISKNALISDFYNLKKQLGHVPSIKEINTLGKYGVDFYTYHFGSYDRFLMTVNEKITLKISDDNLIKNYYNVKEKIGKQSAAVHVASQCTQDEK